MNKTDWYKEEHPVESFRWSGLESQWIAKFRGEEWMYRNDSSKKLHQVFGPYIPLFVNWMGISRRGQTQMMGKKLHIAKLTSERLRTEAYLMAQVPQMGLLPVHIYLDVPWVPYQSLFEQMGFVTDLEGLPLLLERIAHFTPEEISQRETLVKEHIQFLVSST